MKVGQLPLLELRYLKRSLLVFWRIFFLLYLPFLFFYPIYLIFVIFFFIVIEKQKLKEILKEVIILYHINLLRLSNHIYFISFMTFFPSRFPFPFFLKVFFVFLKNAKDLGRIESVGFGEVQF